MMQSYKGDTLSATSNNVFKVTCVIFGGLPYEVFSWVNHKKKMASRIKLLVLIFILCSIGINAKKKSKEFEIQDPKEVKKGAIEKKIVETPTATSILQNYNEYSKPEV